MLWQYSFCSREHTQMWMKVQKETGKQTWSQRPMRTRYHHSTLANFLQTWSSQAGGEVANCCFGKLLCVCFGDGGSHKRYSIFGRIHIAGKIIVLLVMFGNCWSIVEKRLGGERAGIVAACPSTPANICPPCPQLDTFRRVMRIGRGSRGVLQALWPNSLAWTPTRWSPGCWPSPYEGWLPWSVEHHSSALGPYRSQLRALPKSSDPTPRLFPQKSQAVQKKILQWWLLMAGSGGRLAASPGLLITEPLLLPSSRQLEALQLRSFPVTFDFFGRCSTSSQGGTINLRRVVFV